MVQTDPANQKTGPTASDDLNTLLAPVRDMVLRMVPEVPHLATEDRVPLESRGGRDFSERRLDGADIDGVFQVLDRVLEPIHDIAVSAFQRMIDQVAGEASPRLAENERLAHLIMLRVERFGLGLYIESGGDVDRVEVRAQMVPPTRQKRGPNPAIEAGMFKIRGVPGPEGDIPRAPASPFNTHRNTIPHFIVARSHEEARRILMERTERANPLSTSNGSRDDGRPADPTQVGRDIAAEAQPDERPL